MAELTPSFKRRRLDKATSTLSKPFKSPLRAPVGKHGEDGTHPTTADHTINKTESADSKSKENIIVQEQQSQSPSKNPTPIRRTAAVSKPFNHQTPNSTIASTPIRKHKPTSLSSPSSDPVLAPLNSQHSRLLSQLSTLRQELDTARQALKIEEAGRDTELENLVAKWRGAGRLAAEELYAGARDRVNRMGGVRAWKENMEEGRKRRANWDNDGDSGNVERRNDDEDDGDEIGSAEAGQQKEQEQEDEDGGSDEDDVLFPLQLQLRLPGPEFSPFSSFLYRSAMWILLT